MGEGTLVWWRPVPIAVPGCDLSGRGEFSTQDACRNEIVQELTCDAGVSVQAVSKAYGGVNMLSRTLARYETVSTCK